VARSLSGCSNRFWRASSSCLIWPTTNPSRATSRCSSERQPTRCPSSVTSRRGSERLRGRRVGGGSRSVFGWSAGCPGAVVAYRSSFDSPLEGDGFELPVRERWAGQIFFLICELIHIRDRCSRIRTALARGHSAQAGLLEVPIQSPPAESRANSGTWGAPP
jgi:hypothetical protein